MTSVIWLKFLSIWLFKKCMAIVRIWIELFCKKKKEKNEKKKDIQITTDN